MPDRCDKLQATEAMAEDHKSLLRLAGADSLSGESGEHTSGRAGRWWLAACLVLATLFAGKAFWGTSARLPAQPEPALAGENPPAAQNIETIRVGERVVAHDPERDALPGTHGLVIDPGTWRLLRLRAEQRWADGTLDVIHVETLQPPEWVEQQAAQPGATVPLPLDLLEMGLPEDLHAEVVANQPCPAIPDGEGSVVLTTVKSLSANVFELILSDGAGHRETVRPTGLHKFYSGDRDAWMKTQDLRAGERLRSLNGWLTLHSVRRLPGVHRVFNMTVAGEHVFHVSNLGLLSHNSNPCGPDPNKLHHIFGQPKHKLGGLVNHFGSEVAAYNALQNATNATVSQQGITGVFEVVVSVAGQQVAVRGIVINGLARIGTAFIP